MSESITEAVKSKYGSVAASGLSTEHDGVKAVAEAFGYSPEELASIARAPADAAPTASRPPAARNWRRVQARAVKKADPYLDCGDQP